MIAWLLASQRLRAPLEEKLSGVQATRIPQRTGLEVSSQARNGERALRTTQPSLSASGLHVATAQTLLTFRVCSARWSLSVGHREGKGISPGWGCPAQRLSARGRWRRRSPSP